MTAPSEVLVVGASAAGLAAVEALRRRGYEGAVTVVGAESHPPYDRPPLSKKVLAGEWEPGRTRLRAPEDLAALDAEWVLGDPAVALDPLTRTVKSASGRAFAADAIVVATGARPRRLPGQDGVEGVHVLRTVDQAVGVRDHLARAERLVVVGDGVLGAETAATARTLGLDVTVVGPQRTPMEAQLGPLVAERLARTHAEHGVRLRPGTAVAGVAAEDGRVTGVRLDGGGVLPADAVLVAIGAEPDTGWLADSGLDIGDGLVCDSRCRAAEGVYAVGDVARWYHVGLGRTLRLENRTNAVAQAGAVAGAILGDDRPYTPVPYLWSDQYDARIQIHGLPSAGARARVVEDGGGRRFVVRYEQDGRAVGVLGWNMARQARLRRREIEAAYAAPDG